MNHQSDVEPVLRAYLADTGDRAPDRVLEDVAARIARQPRRRTWRLHGRPFVNNTVKLSVAAAAVVVVAVVGFSLFARPGTGQAGAGETPSAATPTAAAAVPTSAAVGTPPCTPKDLRVYKFLHPGETVIRTEIMTIVTGAASCSKDAPPTIVLRSADGVALATANATTTGRLIVQPSWYYPTEFALKSWCGQAASLPLSLEMIVNGAPAKVEDWTITSAGDLPTCDSSTGTAITATGGGAMH